MIDIATLALALGASAGGAAIVLLHGRHRPARARAVRRADGTQEARVVVEHRYVPDRIELVAGIPAVLRFDRREDDPCSELLISELFPSVHQLAPHAETKVRFTPAAPGTYVFTCGLGMYSGWIVVRPESAR